MGAGRDTREGESSKQDGGETETGWQQNGSKQRQNDSRTAVKSGRRRRRGNTRITKGSGRDQHWEAKAETTARIDACRQQKTSGYRLLQHEKLWAKVAETV